MPNNTDPPVRTHTVPPSSSGSDERNRRLDDLDMSDGSTKVTGESEISVGASEKSACASEMSGASARLKQLRKKRPNILGSMT